MLKIIVNTFENTKLNILKMLPIQIGKIYVDKFCETKTFFLKYRQF